MLFAKNRRKFNDLNTKSNKSKIAFVLFNKFHELFFKKKQKKH